MHDWRSVFESNCRAARRNILANGELLSAFLIYTHSNTHCAVAAPWGSDEQRTVTLKLLRILCVAHDAAAVCWINEAWTLAIDPKVDNPHIRPKDSERRQEAVVVAFLSQATADQDQVSYLSSREILRNTAGKVTDLGPERFLSGDRCDSVLAEILPPVRVPPEIRQAAKRIAEDSGLLRYFEMSPTKT